MEKLLRLHQNNIHVLEPKHFETCSKTSMVQGKTVKSVHVLSLECFVLYGE